MTWKECSLLQLGSAYKTIWFSSSKCVALPTAEVARRRVTKAAGRPAIRRILESSQLDLWGRMLLRVWKLMNGIGETGNGSKC